MLSAEIRVRRLSGRSGGDDGPHHSPRSSATRCTAAHGRAAARARGDRRRRDHAAARQVAQAVARGDRHLHYLGLYRRCARRASARGADPCPVTDARDRPPSGRSPGASIAWRRSDVANLFRDGRQGLPHRPGRGHGRIPASAWSSPPACPSAPPAPPTAADRLGGQLNASKRERDSIRRKHILSL